MKAFFAQQWFLLLLLIVLSSGIVFAETLRPLSESGLLRGGIVAAVMFCMALSLEAEAMLRLLRRPGAPLLAVFVTYLVLPLTAWFLSGLLPGDLGPGLQVAAATPCTLASAAVWTRRAGGNDAVATLVTVLTNGSCFFMAPLWLWIMTGIRATDSAIQLDEMTGQLAALVVVPIVIAQMLRMSSAVRKRAKQHLVGLSVVAQFGVLSMVLQGAIRTGLQLREHETGVGVLDLFVMVTVVLALHLSMFWLGVKLGKLFGYPRGDQIAIGFAGSQKTLMVGILLAISLKASILPMVAYHCLQLIVDTLIADRYRQRMAGAVQAESSPRRDDGEGAAVPGL
jgi:sodium/bile acid cotransporter 7